MKPNGENNLNLICCAGTENSFNQKMEVIPLDDGLNHIRTNVTAVRAVIKMQGLIRGHLTRQHMKKYKMSVHMSDKHFGHSINGTFSNKVVEKILQKLGPYQFDSDKEK